MAAYNKDKKKTKQTKIPSNLTTNKSAKIPSDLNPPKKPRWIGTPNLENIYLSWRFSRADLGGPYQCRDFSFEDYIQLWDRLRAFESMNSDALKNSGSLHDITIDQLSHDAQRRLDELQLDDVDRIYSFRIDGKCRLWCIRYSSIFYVLWWDRKHEVFPVGKKHT